jgi:tetratricopeptide (TPR) repeat protein
MTWLQDSKTSKRSLATKLLFGAAAGLLLIGCAGVLTTEAPLDAAGWYARGVKKSVQKDYPGAAADFSRALVLDPRHVPALVHRGYARKQTGNLIGAIADYESAIALSPSDPTPHRLLTAALTAAGHPDAVTVVYERALRLNPGNSFFIADAAFAFLWRAREKENNGDIDGAIADYTRAIDLGSEQTAQYVYLRKLAEEERGDIRSVLAQLTR